MAMEGVPRIPMISFPMKRSADTPNFKPRLRSFISSHYNENADSYSGEIHELESLRSSSVHVSKDFTGCATLKKYFCQLNFLKSRFPLHDGSPIAVTFSWYDVYSDQVHGWSDIEFEMSCVLFNIGALHTELGSNEKRQNADEMKSACTHYQCAAWAFQHLRHNYQKFFTPDISPDVLSIIINICLGQAQECILEKSLIDNRKSTLQAKVTLAVVEYYQLSLKTIDQLLKDANQYSEKTIKTVKKWRRLVELKVAYYSALTNLFRGLQAEDQSKWGERITFYKAASEKLEAAFKLVKSMDKSDPSVNETLVFTNDVIVGKLKVSEKENEFIYHDKVPELSAVIGDIKGVSLVKGVPLKIDDTEVSGRDIFGRLVPMEAHEASSLYSEEKAKLLRLYSGKIEEKNQLLEKFLIALQLDQLDLHSNEMKLPQELIDCCAALTANPDILRRLSELMTELSGLFHDVDGNLNEIRDLLQNQEAKENEYQSLMGKRPPNNLLTELAREEQKYLSANKAAAESNQQLHEAMKRHMTNIQILMKPFPEVLKHIPAASDIGPTDDNAIREMQRLVGKVEEMRKQREMLEAQLREAIQNDDITKQLVVKKDEDQDEVFREELKKFEKTTQLIDQNLLAQENITRALREANANYSETRKATAEIVHKRNEIIQSLITSYEAYDELLVKCTKGIDFYKKLNENVVKLLQRMRSVSKVQDEERESALKTLMKKLPTQPPLTGVLPPVLGLNPALPNSTVEKGPLKLKDYLDSRRTNLPIPQVPSSIHQAQPQLPQLPASFSQPGHAPPIYYSQSQSGFYQSQQLPTSFHQQTQDPLRFSQPQHVPSTAYQQQLPGNFYQTQNWPPSFSHQQQVSPSFSQPYQVPTSVHHTYVPAHLSQPQQVQPSYSRPQQETPNFPQSHQSVHQVNSPLSFPQPQTPATANQPPANFPQQVQPSYSRPQQETPNFSQSQQSTIMHQVHSPLSFPQPQYPATVNQPPANFSQQVQPSYSRPQQETPNVSQSHQSTIMHEVNSSLSYPQPQTPATANQPPANFPQAQQVSSNLQLPQIVTTIQQSQYYTNQTQQPQYQYNEIKQPQYYNNQASQQYSLPSSASQQIGKPDSTSESSSYDEAPIKVNKKVNKTKVDPFSDPTTLEKFTLEVEKLSSLIESFHKKSLNGPTNLDLKWKEVVDLQNSGCLKKTISVARCYPMKNRFPDILPFDQTRVPLPSTKDDYINASFLKELSPSSISFIVTQAPLPSTYEDFWHMIWSESVELIVCIANDTDLKGQVYWLDVKGQEMTLGPFKVVLQTRNIKQNYLERIMSITHRDLKQTRVAIHLQFSEWAGNVFPANPSHLLSFVNEVHSFYEQQRNVNRPVVVHCIPGVGKSGVFCVLSAAIQDINDGKGIIDLTVCAATASSQRKGIMIDKEYLRFSYHCLLYYCQDLLLKRGILSARVTFDEKKPNTHTRHPSQDFLEDQLRKTKIEMSIDSEQDQNQTKRNGDHVDNTHSPSHLINNVSDKLEPSIINSQESSRTSYSSLFTNSPKMKAKMYTDLPANLTNLEPSNFQLSLKNKDGSSKTSAREIFETGKGALVDRKIEDDSDPLSSLDPLWAIKK